MGQVQFDEEADVKRPTLNNPRPRTSLDSLMRSGLVKSASQANAVLLIVVALLAYGAYYVFVKSFPESPALGQDVLKPGESVPENRNL